MATCFSSGVLHSVRTQRIAWEWTSIPFSQNLKYLHCEIYRARQTFFVRHVTGSQTPQAPNPGGHATPIVHPTVFFLCTNGDPSNISSSLSHHQLCCIESKRAYGIQIHRICTTAPNECNSTPQQPPSVPTLSQSHHVNDSTQTTSTEPSSPSRPAPQSTLYPPKLW